MSEQAHEITIKNRKLLCTHCGGDRHNASNAQINTPAAMFFGVDWLNQGATVYVCKECGFVQWFVHQSTEDDQRESEEIQKKIDAVRARHNYF